MPFCRGSFDVYRNLNYLSIIISAVVLKSLLAGLIFQLQALLGVFKGINLRSNGTISRQEFEHYLRWNAKDLLPHAKGIYSACTAKCPKARAAESDVDVHDLLDFAQLLRVLYPGADADDLRELLELVDKPKAPLVVDWSDKVTECRGLFNMYNVSKDGWMTPDEFSEGMEKLDMDEDDMEFHYNDLFPVTGGMRPINFAKFFQWYTGHELPEEYANESNFDVKVAL